MEAEIEWEMSTVPIPMKAAAHLAYQLAARNAGRENRESLSFQGALFSEQKRFQEPECHLPRR